MESIAVLCDVCKSYDLGKGKTGAFSYLSIFPIPITSMPRASAFFFIILEVSFIIYSHLR